jgi:ATP-dependent RNA helicase RhlE
LLCPIFFGIIFCLNIDISDISNSNKGRIKAMTFRDLGLCDPILKALDQEGYVTPTPIQQGAIPPALEGRDVLGCAQTGTGKTCAFSTPILQRLDQRHPRPRVIRALILTPTRELAIQIQESMAAYGRNLRLKSAVIFGGVGQQPQVDAIRKGLDILVATPGRLLDLHGQGLLDLSHIEIFVLDEADRMLDMGFIHDVRRVLKLLPEKKQTLFFSATMPPEVMGLVNDLLHDYARVEVDPVSSPVEVIQQSLYYVDKNNKTKLLAHLVEKLDIPSALVFSRTKHGANRIAQDLNKAGITAAAIHGNKSQTARVQALNDFKSGKVRVLVATDIAARGIDIEELAYVFNYNLPDVPETYVHRIGRTGRAGHDGVAISFCQFDEKDELKAIQKLLGKPIPVVEDHPFPMTNFDPPMKDKHGRPVNAEDAEARAAAKERRRQRDADNKAKAEAKKQEAEQVSLAPAEETAPETDATAKKKRRRKKKTVEKMVETVGGHTAEPAAQAPVERRERSGSGRGVRQGRLEDTLPADPSMPVTEFYKPNPLDSDIIMDATARLLAPRRSAASAGHAHRVRQSEGRKQTRPVHAKAEQTDGQHSQEQKRGQQKKQTPAKSAQSAHTADKEPAAPAKKKKRRRNDRPRPIERSLYARQKDSTEQESLMRPYYMNHDD